MFLSSVQCKLMHWNTINLHCMDIKKIFFCILQKKYIYFLIRFCIWYFQCCLNVYLCVYVIAPHHHQWHSCICNTITFPSYRTRHLNCSCDERHLTQCFHFHFCIWAWALMTVKPNAQHGVKQNTHQCLIQPAFIIAAVLMPQWWVGTH